MVPVSAALNHRFHSNFSDGPDLTLLRPSCWNDTLVFSGGAQGTPMFRDTGSADGWTFADSPSKTVVVGGNTAIQNGQLLILGGPTDTSLTNNAMEIRCKGGGIAWKDAAASIQYAAVLAGGTAANGTVNPLRILGGAGIVFQEFGGAAIETGVPIAFTKADVSHPMIKWNSGDATIGVSFRLGDDSGPCDARMQDLYANQLGGGAVAGHMLVGGIAAGRQFGGIWVGNITPDFTNYSFLGSNSGSGAATTLFNAPGSTSTIDFRINNGTVFRIANTGPLILTLPGFVSGDHYLVIDSNGNIHKSAIGPNS